MSKGAGSDSKDSISIDLNDLLDSGDPKYNIPLYGGDVVTVPRSGVVYAVGAVLRPGGFVMETDRQQMTVLKVVSLSGGLSPTAKPSKAVILRQPREAPRGSCRWTSRRSSLSRARTFSCSRVTSCYVPDSTGKHALRSQPKSPSPATGAAIIAWNKE